MAYLGWRQRACVAALLGIAAPLAIAPPAPADELAPVDVSALPAVVYVAHRGGAMEGRENSMSAFRSALNSGKVDVLELDTRSLSDGTVVVMHDSTVSRTSRVSGSVDSFSLNSWSEVVLDIGSWLDPEPAPEPAPTLAAVLDDFGGKIALSVEAKEADEVGRIAKLIKDRGLTSSVYVDTNDPEVAKQIHALGLKTQLWRSAEQMQDDVPAQFAPYVDLLDVDIEGSDADIRKFVMTSGVPRVWAHTLTTRAERDRAKRLGVTGFVADDPRYLQDSTRPYPMPPTVLRVLDGPQPTQVSDRTTMRMVVSQQAGPSNPDAVPHVVGRGVTSTSSIDNRRVRTLVLSTVHAEAGRGRVAVTVSAGQATERRWTSASKRVGLRLTPEDLQLRPRVRTRGRHVHLRIRLLDSAATDYTGTGHETGSSRTVAGLDRAVLTVTFRHHGRVVWSTTVHGTDAGSDAVGDGKVGVSWRAPTRGRYRVQVSQHGSVYRELTVGRHVRLR